MQIGKGAAIMGERYGLDTSPALCQSFDSQSSFPTFLSLLFIYSFQGNQGRTVGNNLKSPPVLLMNPPQS